MRNRINRRIPVPALFLGAVLLSGCSALSMESNEAPLDEEGNLSVCEHLTVQADETFQLVDYNDILAPDGMIYVSWGIGSSTVYTDEDGEESDLYEAGLYLLISEFSEEASAQEQAAEWAASAQADYEVQGVETLDVFGAAFTCVTYLCSEDSPYAEGISVYGAAGTDAVCAELTALDTYEGDLEELMLQFLSDCVFAG